MDTKEEKNEISSFKSKLDSERQKFWELEAKNPASTGDGKGRPSVKQKSKLGNVFLFIGTLIATIVVSAFVLMNVVK